MSFEFNKRNIRTILLLIIFTMIVYWGLNHSPKVLGLLEKVFTVLAPLIVGLCFAFIINVLLRPIEKIWDAIIGRRKQKLWIRKIKRLVCILISILVIAGIIFILIFMVVPEMKRTIESVIVMFPEYMLRVEAWWAETAALLASHSILMPELKFDMSEVGRMISELLTKSGYAFFGRTVEITASIFSGIFNVVLGLAFSIYVLYQKEKLGGNIKKLFLAFLPQEKVKKILSVLDLTNRTFSNFVTGQLTEAFIIGSLCFMGMLIFRMPHAPAISVLVGFTALIPVFGAFFGIIIGAFLILMVDPMKALWFILFIIVLQQLEGDIIYPKVVGKSVGLPGIWVLAAVTVGGSMFGVFGMLVSVPVCSVLYCLGKQAANIRLKEKGLDIIKD